ncbi:aldehyde dehydrogenase family protein [Streptomyces sp. TP-A0874]|uniref:aldehyde dehydrogenase family protein n=1 Tax=Streptomyces sp. TP-A0874 TaxID=549819 RepID=UPI000853840C|nr:aldehyde dehydrogenase family protein [Streptomyces sp. TP-A0874]
MTTEESIFLFIGGEDVRGAGALIERENPAITTMTAGSAQSASPEQVDKAVGAAFGAGKDWSRLSVEERARQVLEAWSFDEEDRDRLGRLLTLELGKVLADARGELGYGIANVAYAAEHATVLDGRSERHREGRFEFGTVPYGVVAAIIPWNAPLVLSSVKVGPALMAGNTVVVKPSPLAPLAVTTYLRRIAERLPPGVLNVVNGDGDTGARLVSDPRIGKIAFTGSGQVATSILEAAAGNITPSLLELGGNDAAIVLPDTALTDEMMSRIVFASFLTAGQVCMAIKRLLVHRSRTKEFISRYREVAERVLVLGDPMAETTTLGPVVSGGQRDRVRALVDRARSDGATVETLGRQGDSGFDLSGGYFLSPTLVHGLEAGHELVRTEQFGPTVPVLPYDDLEQAVTMANDSPYGLCASVWTSDEGRAFEIGRQLHVGTVFVNTHNRSGMSLRAPFGGVKKSGYGREFGVAGLYEFSQDRVISHLAATENGSGPDAGRRYPS